MFDLFRRIGNLFKGFFSLFVGSTEESNPKALLAVEIDTFNSTVATYNTTLGKSQGLTFKLKAQVATARTNLAKADASMRAAAAAKLNDRAGQYAVEVKRLTAEITENQSQLDHAEEAYQLQTRQRDAFVKQARERIERVKGKISSTEMLVAQADLAKMVSVQVFDTTGGGLNKIEEALDNRAAEAQGIARVATDALSHSAFLTTESEQRALESAALAELMGSPQLAAPEAHPALPAPSSVQDVQFVDELAGLKVAQTAN